MSYADKVFINMCRDIIDNGTDTRRRKSKTGMGRRHTGIYDQKIRSCEPV